MAEEQVSTRSESFVEIVDDPAARSRVEVNEHVATKYDVYPAKGRGFDAVEQVQVPEIAAFPEPVDNVMPVALLDEVGCDEIVGGRTKCAAPVDPAPSRRDVALGDVAA